MSRRDVETVCTLAAHLSATWWSRVECAGDGQEAPPYKSADMLTDDAMKLQKLGRRTRNMYAKMHNDFRGVMIARGLEETDRIEKAGNEILNAYGLSCHVEFERQFVIDGLPSGIKDKQGFCI